MDVPEKLPLDASVCYLSDLAVDLCESEGARTLAAKVRRCVLERGVSRLHRASDEGAFALALLADAVVEDLEEAGEDEEADELFSKVESALANATREGFGHLRGLVAMLENRAYRFLKHRGDLDRAEGLHRRLLKYSEDIAARSGLEDDRKELIGLYELHCDLVAANGTYWECSSLCRSRIPNRTVANRCPGLEREMRIGRSCPTRCVSLDLVGKGAPASDAAASRLDVPAITIIEGGLKGKDRKMAKYKCPNGHVTTSNKEGKNYCCPVCGAPAKRV